MCFLVDDTKIRQQTCIHNEFSIDWIKGVMKWIWTSSFLVTKYFLRKIIQIQFAHRVLILL